MGVGMARSVGSVGDEEGWKSGRRVQSRKVKYNQGDFQTRFVVGGFLEQIEGKAMFLKPV